MGLPPGAGLSAAWPGPGTPPGRSGAAPGPGGIPLERSQSPAGGPRLPCLGVIIHLDRPWDPRRSYVFSLEVFFVRAGAGEGCGGNALQITWCKEAVGDVQETGPGLDWSTLYQALGLLVDEFVQDYLTVNPHILPGRTIN